MEVGARRLWNNLLKREVKMRIEKQRMLRTSSTGRVSVEAVMLTQCFERSSWTAD
jgi:hypothetical protein